MEFVSVLFAALAFAMALTAACGIIRPQLLKNKRGEVPERKEALAGGLAGLALFGTLSYCTQPDEITATAKLNSSPPSASARHASQSEVKKTADEPVTSEFRTEFTAAWETTKAADHECAKAWEKTTKALQRADRFGGYDAAMEGAAICTEAASSIEALYPVKNWKENKATEALESAILDCKNAEAARASALREIAQTLDGDMRPSEVASTRDAAQMSAEGIVRCGFVFVQAAELAGVKLHPEED